MTTKLIGLFFVLASFTYMAPVYSGSSEDLLKDFLQVFEMLSDQHTYKVLQNFERLSDSQKFIRECVYLEKEAREAVSRAHQGKAALLEAKEGLVAAKKLIEDQLKARAQIINHIEKMFNKLILSNPSQESKLLAQKSAMIGQIAQSQAHTQLQTQYASVLEEIAKMESKIVEKKVQEKTALAFSKEVTKKIVGYGLKAAEASASLYASAILFWADDLALEAKAAGTKDFIKQNFTEMAAFEALEPWQQKSLLKIDPDFKSRLELFTRALKSELSSAKIESK